MFVRTERMFLRPAWPEDLDDLVQMLGDEDIRRNVGVVQLPRSAQEVRAYLERPRDPRLPHFFMYLRSADGPQLVGSIGLGGDGDEAELGYWVAPRFRGRGYAAEAVRAVLKYARSLGHRRVYANHFADSDASARVLESAGFQDTGRIRSRYSDGRCMEAKVKIYVAELKNGASPRLEASAEIA